MRVSVLINSKAGSVNADLVEAKVREALFRCDLRFCRPQTLPEMCDFLHGERAHNTDYFIICGGDGTINAALQCLMSCNGADLQNIPPIALVRSGTANDLAHEMGVSIRIDQAVRNILEGTVKKIDVIEVTGDGKKAFMITNGGLGLPAMSAEMANDLRASLQKVSTCPKTAKGFQLLARHGYQMVKKMGPNIYVMMVMEAIRRWDAKDWNLELEIPGKTVVETSAPIVLVNNQPSIGAHFLPAPFTSNSDGTVNLLLSETKTAQEHMRAALHIRKGKVNRLPHFKSFELKEFRLKSQNPKRSLTFFGDGEILHKDVQEIAVKCLHRGLPVVVAQ